MANIPKVGRSAAQLLEALECLKANDWKWKAGRSFSLVYYAGAEHQALLEKAYALFMSENCLSASAFPSLAQMEGEVVSMLSGLLTTDLIQQSEPVCGSMTSGGTESAILALKAYRDSQSVTRKGGPLEVILPRSAHPAYLKASHYLGVKPVITECAADFRADPEAVRRSLSPRTIAIIASAPSFPHGVVDPIPVLGQMALEARVGLHIDACLGGVALPFIRKLGFAVPDFDFRVDGVTSIAVDLHKYAFAAKGASVLLFRSKELRRHQFFATDQWSGGLFGSPGVLGTRSGGVVAAAWAAIHSLGEAGYLKIFDGIMRTTRKFQDGVRAIPGLRIFGEPEMSVFAIGSQDPELLSIFNLADEMERRHWNLDRLNNPDAIHFIISTVHESVTEQFLSDLSDCTEIARRSPRRRISGETAELYGMTSKFSRDRNGSPVERALWSLEDRY